MALRRRVPADGIAGSTLCAVFLRNLELYRRVLHFVVHVLLLRLHPLDFFANARDFPFHIDNVRKLSGALSLESDQPLLRVACVIQTRLEIDVLAGHVGTVLRFLTDFPDFPELE